MLLYTFSYKCQSIDFWLEMVIFRISLFLMSSKMEEKQEKKISKKQRIIVWIFAFIVLIISINSWMNKMNDSSQTRTTQTIQKSNPLQDRLNRINELFVEDTAFEKAEKIDSSTIWISFTSAPSEDIETITRWQAVNLSNELNGVASVKTYIWWKAQMFCIATKWTVNDCFDYR